MRLWTAQCPIPQTKHTLVSVIMDEIAGRNIKLCLVQTSVCWHSFMCDSTDNQPTTDHHQRSKLTIKRYLLPLSFWPFMQCSLTEFRWCILLNNCTPAACIGYLYLMYWHRIWCIYFESKWAHQTFFYVYNSTCNQPIVWHIRGQN